MRVGAQKSGRSFVNSMHPFEMSIFFYIIFVILLGFRIVVVYRVSRIVQHVYMLGET